MQSYFAPLLSVTLVAIPATSNCQNRVDLRLPLAPASQVRPATKADLAAFELTRGTVQILQAPRTTGRAFETTVVLDRVSYGIELKPHSLRAKNYRLLVDDGKAIRAVDPGPVRTYRGRVLGVPGSIVAASLIGGQLSAQIHLPNAVFGVQPLTEARADARRDHYIVYAKRDVIVDGLRCGTTDQLPIDSRAHGGGSVGPAAVKEAEIAIDADFDYYRKKGNSNVAQTQAEVTKIMNTVDAIYKRDTEITYKITTILVRSSQVYPGSTSSQTALRNFQSRWNSNHTGIQRDLAHRFNGFGSFGGVIGTAYLRVVCNRSSGYGNSRAISGNDTTNVGLVAHEAGHNWAAQHCNNAPPCNIMCSSLSGCNRNLGTFGQSARNQIIAHRNSRTCLSDAGGGTYTVFGAGCKGSGKTSPTCMNQNENLSLRGASGFTDVTYLLELTAPSALQMQGFEIKLASRRSGSVTIPAFVYDANAAGQPNQAIANGTMSVGSATALYSTTLNRTVSLTSGQKFFIGFRNANPTITVGTMNPGVVVPYWRNNGTNGAWVRFATRAWGFRVKCSPVAGAIPVLGNSAAPEIGKTYTVTMREGNPNSAAILFTGSSDKMWGPFTLPLDLAPIGAAGCSILAGGEVQQGFPTRANGSIDAVLSVPNAKPLIGIAFFQQWVILDSATSAGVVTSNGGRGLIGGTQ